MDYQKRELVMLSASHARTVLPIMPQRSGTPELAARRSVAPSKKDYEINSCSWLIFKGIFAECVLKTRYHEHAVASPLVFPCSTCAGGTV
jgi:hypothetical protein